MYDAAAILATASGMARAAEPYQQTGVMQRGDEAVWQAFATFAGYSYDASVWSDTRALPIVSLSDEGTALVVCLDEEEQHRLLAAVAPAQVVPLREARAEDRKRR